MTADPPGRRDSAPGRRDGGRSVTRETAAPASSETASAELGDLWPDVAPQAARRLMLAAVQAFAERGYHATTTRDIAAAAGMSPAALYVHFPSKAAVLFAIARSGHEQALELVRDVVTTGADPEERIQLLVERFVAWHARRHRIARVVQYEFQALPAREYRVVAELRRHTEALVREVIEDGVAAGQFRVDDVPTAARAVLSLGIDVARWYAGRSRPSPRELGRRYAELVLRMLT